MADIKILAESLAKLTSEEIGSLAVELQNLGARTTVSIIDPPKVPPIGGGFPGEIPPIPTPTPGSGSGDDSGSGSGDDSGSGNENLDGSPSGGN